MTHPPYQPLSRLQAPASAARPWRLALVRRARAGAVSLIVGLLAIPLMGAVGLALDMGRAYFVKARLTTALDSAALAGGRVMTVRDPTPDIQMYFNANFVQGIFSAATATPTIAVSADQSTVSTSATANMPTTFMRLLGEDNVAMSASNIVRRTYRGQELVLVMDNTGSMGEDVNGNKTTGPSSKIYAMKDAATTLLDLLYGAGNDTVPNLWVGVVPFVTSVNIGPGRTSWLNATDFAAKTYAATTWKGCVEARGGSAGEEDDTPPSGGLWNSYYYPSTKPPGNGDNDWTVGGPANEVNWPYATAIGQYYGPNIFCPDARVLPLQASKAAAASVIAGMMPTAGGGTMGNLGLAWGWRALSPRWRGLWGGATPASMPLDYGTTYMDKVVVFLTDGRNEWATYGSYWPYSAYTGYGRLAENRLGTTNAATATGIVNTRMAQLCESMKSNGIIVYTIGLMVNDATANSLLAGCATDANHYFSSPTPGQLAGVFQNIAGQLSNLRLQK